MLTMLSLADRLCRVGDLFPGAAMNAVYRANGCLLALAVITILTVIGFAALTT